MILIVKYVDDTSRDEMVNQINNLKVHRGIDIITIRLPHGELPEILVLPVA